MKSEHSADTEYSDAQRGAIHSTVMALLSLPAYFLTLFGVRQMVVRGNVSSDTLESIGLVFLLFMFWNVLGLFLGVRAILSPRAFKPLGIFASTIHFIVLSMALATLMR